MIRKQSMNLESRIAAFSKLGNFLSQFSSKGIIRNDDIVDVHDNFELLQEGIHKAYIQNPWFTEANILYSLEAWSGLLTEHHLNDWIGSYPY
ncbi:MAG: acyl-CoA reductase, partial [Bacteroidota bacterium]